MCPCHVFSGQIHSVFVTFVSCVPERCKIIHDMQKTQKSIDVNMCCFTILCLISVAFIVAVVEQCMFILVFFVL